MATTEELFISVPLQVYRKNKSAILLGQTELLRTLKHLQNISVLSYEKNNLKTRLQKLLVSLIGEINSLQKKMPTPQVPKSILIHEDKEVSLTAKKEKKPSKRDAIEDELLLIQEKLKRLNF